MSDRLDAPGHPPFDAANTAWWPDHLREHAQRQLAADPDLRPPGVRQMAAMVERRVTKRRGTKGGKKEGDGAAWASNDAFIKELVSQLREFESAVGRDLRLDDRVAIQRRLSVHKSAFYDWLRDALHLRWADFVREWPAIDRNYAELRGNDRPQDVG